jgi:hypothetical protein
MGSLVQKFQSITLKLEISSTEIGKASLRASTLRLILDEAENMKECVRLIIIIVVLGTYMPFLPLNM